MASTVRQLVAGSGTITYNANGLVFSQSQSFKEGTQIYIPSAFPTRYTIKGGSGTVWQPFQPIYVGQASGAFYCSDPSTSRARGGSGSTMGEFVAGATHFVYVSVVDDSGNPDWYLYVDTLFPEKGVHPYTKDRWTGASRVTSDGGLYPGEQGVGTFGPDIAKRVGALDNLPPTY